MLGGVQGFASTQRPVVSCCRAVCAVQGKARYAELADMLGLGGEKPREKVANLIRAVEELKATCGIPVSAAGEQAASPLAPSVGSKWGAKPSPATCMGKATRARWNKGGIHVPTAINWFSLESVAGASNCSSPNPFQTKLMCRVLAVPQCAVLHQTEPLSCSGCQYTGKWLASTTRIGCSWSFAVSQMPQLRYSPSKKRDCVACAPRCSPPSRRRLGLRRRPSTWRCLRRWWRMPLMTRWVG